MEAAVSMLKTNCKKRAREEDISIPNIYSDELKKLADNAKLSSINEDISKYLPEFKKIKTTFYRQRSKTRGKSIGSIAKINDLDEKENGLI